MEDMKNGLPCVRVSSSLDSSVAEAVEQWNESCTNAVMWGRASGCRVMVWMRSTAWWSFSALSSSTRRMRGWEALVSLSR